MLLLDHLHLGMRSATVLGRHRCIWHLGNASFNSNYIGHKHALGVLGVLGGASLQALAGAGSTSEGPAGAVPGAAGCGDRQL
jgi:hypothetical protein